MVDWGKRGKAAQNVLDSIAITPLVKLNKVTKGIEPDILTKLEWFSPTGSIKDRIYYRMITEAIKRKELTPGMEILGMERKFNEVAGFTSAHDRLPEFMTYEPLPPHNTVFDVPDKILDSVYEV